MKNVPGNGTQPQQCPVKREERERVEKKERTKEGGGGIVFQGSIAAVYKNIIEIHE